MEIMRGKHTSFIGASEIAERLTGYDTIHIDIGTGDGRYVQHIARTDPTRFVIGIDACRENLFKVSRRAPANTLFVIANARFLPLELGGFAATVTINFPWGSLLNGLLTQDRALLDGLLAISRLNAAIEVMLNGGALAEAGWTLTEGGHRVRHVLTANGFDMCHPVTLRARELKAYPTTWAKRIAFGRDPRALYLRGVR
jgi:16S rRNA (adenine(1408)-N(1))-methyltransferase